MAIAEHAPQKLKKANRGLLSMSKEQLHDFASTPEADLPYSAPKPRKPSDPDNLKF